MPEGLTFRGSANQYYMECAGACALYENSPCLFKTVSVVRVSVEQLNGSLAFKARSPSVITSENREGGDGVMYELTIIFT